MKSTLIIIIVILFFAYDMNKNAPLSPEQLVTRDCVYLNQSFNKKVDISKIFDMGTRDATFYVYKCQKENKKRFSETLLHPGN